MRTILILSGIALLVGVMCLGANDDVASPKRDGKASTHAQSRADSSDKLSSKAEEEQPAGQSVTNTRSPDEDAIRHADESLTKAYREGNAKSVAAHFTTGGEYVDEQGNVYHGHEAIEKSMAEFFARNPGCKLRCDIDSIRFLSPGVAVEDGTAMISLPGNSASLVSYYTTTYVKLDGKWLSASLRNYARKSRREHREQLQQLDWLIGDWVDEGDDSMVSFSCQPVDNGAFLLRKFTIHIAGQEVLSGTQRIGWDPLSGKFKTWIFDSDGGYAEGTWHRDGENWILKSSGVTADGETASGTSIYTFVNPHTMTWQSIDHEVAGVKQPDGEVVVIVRQPPVPSTETAVAPK